MGVEHDSRGGSRLTITFGPCRLISVGARFTPEHHLPVRVGNWQAGAQTEPHIAAGWPHRLGQSELILGKASMLLRSRLLEGPWRAVNSERCVPSNAAGIALGESPNRVVQRAPHVAHGLATYDTGFLRHVLLGLRQPYNLAAARRVKPDANEDPFELYEGLGRAFLFHIDLSQMTDTGEPCYLTSGDQVNDMSARKCDENCTMQPLGGYNASILATGFLRCRVSHLRRLLPCL